MFSRNGTNAFTGTCSDKVETARSLIDRVEALVVGVGSGMTAAGGLSYADPALVEKWYPEYARAGLKTIVEIQAAFWWFERCRPERYWAFWARHIRHIRYEAQALQPYKDLYSLAGSRDYFICTTNADGQLEKTGFPRERIFAPQGNYALFQCRTPCRDEVFDNREMICVYITLHQCTHSAETVHASRSGLGTRYALRCACLSGALCIEQRGSAPLQKSFPYFVSSVIPFFLRMESRPEIVMV